MKTFYVSLLIFCALLALITWNTLFVNKSMSQLEEAILALPDCDEGWDPFERIQERWYALYRPLSFSVSFEDLRNMDAYLFQMKTALREKDALQYETAREGALSTLRTIRRPEQFSLSGIL